MNETLNHDHDEARSLHRIVRAMHDGECPRCHCIHDAPTMRNRFIASAEVGKYDTLHGWECPSCSFHITQSEAIDVFKQFAPFMERNLAVFEAWRETRNKETSSDR